MFPYFFLFGIGLCLVYGAITWLSAAFIYGQGHLQRPIVPFLGLYAGAFVVYGLAVWQLSRQPRQDVILWLVLGFAVLFRGILLFSNPIQEDDFYRYLWDGKVVASGLNPYRFAPLEVIEGRGASQTLQPYIDIAAQDGEGAHFGFILSRVNHPSVPTIYPPLAQAIFGLTALVAPGSLFALRLAFLGFDLGMCGLIVALLKHCERSPVWVLIYAWSPLVLKESVNSAHYDTVPTFFLTLALFLCVKGKSVLAHTSLGIAILGKIYPLLLVPVLFRRVGKTHGSGRALLGLGVMAGIIVLGYAPFLEAGSRLWQGTLTFAEQWQTNSLVFPLLSRLVGERWAANAIIAGVLGGVVLTVLRHFDLRDDRQLLWASFLLLGVLFLLSPVGNPWYFVWIVPFLCIFPLRSWLLLSGLLGLYYLAFYFMYRGTLATFRWVVWLEYLPFYGMVVWEWWQYRRGRESQFSRTI